MYNIFFYICQQKSKKSSITFPLTLLLRMIRSIIEKIIPRIAGRLKTRITELMNIIGIPKKAEKTIKIKSIKARIVE